MIFAGVGSRKAPPEALKLAHRLGFYLAAQGLGFRSGGAEGMDTAFERGVRDAHLAMGGRSGFAPGVIEVFRPAGVEAWCLAEVERYLDPGVSLTGMGPGVRGLIARDMQQVLGRHGDSPSQCVLYWTPKIDGTDRSCGGTRYAVRCAKAWNIPALNLLDTDFSSALAWASDHVGEMPLRR